MSEIERPTEFRDAMQLARELTVVDQRTEFEVYLDVARRLVAKMLGPDVKNLPISDERKKDILHAEAYASAQPAHLSDASAYKPTRLLEMLEELGAFDFDCKKHCDRRKSLIKDTHDARNKDERPSRKAETGLDHVFFFGDINEIFQLTLEGEIGKTFERPLVTSVLVCKTSPDCQENCPLPEVGSETYTDTVGKTVEAMIEKGW